MQQVREPRKELVELAREGCEPCLARSELLAERADLALQRIDVAAGGLGAADRFGALVAQLAQAFDARLQLLALGFERNITVAVELETTLREVRRHGIEILAQRLGV